MVKNINKESDVKQVFYKDSVGRGWQSWKLSEPSRSCFGLRCKERGMYELNRVTSGLARREFLCHRCFSERIKAYGMRKIDHLEE